MIAALIGAGAYLIAKRRRLVVALVPLGFLAFGAEVRAERFAASRALVGFENQRDSAGGGRAM